MTNILITGASSGIGASIALKMASQCYISGLGIHYNKNREGIVAVGTEILKMDKQLLTFKHDFEKGNINLVESFIRHFGSIDILVNVAGIISPTNFEDLTVKEYNKIMDINTRAAFFVARDAFVAMKENGGKIINISSVTTKFGHGRNGSIQYAMSKAAIDTMTLGLARLGAKHKILVNSVSPGVIDTLIHATRPDREERKKLIPLGEFGSTEDIANMVEYLASGKGDFITGQIIYVSGGE